MTNKFETPELDKLEDLPPLGRDPNLLDLEGTLPTPMWETHWPSFATALQHKLARGYLEYGDDSFKRNPQELLSEIQEELLDVCGWAFVMLVRLKALGDQTDGLDKVQQS